MARAAVLQMISSADVAENLHTLKPYFAKAQDAQADLIVLPENFACMGKNKTDKLAIAEDYGSGLIQDTIRTLAAQYNLWVIAGSLPIKGTSNRVRASCIVYDNSGAGVARYDKIHLFDVQVSAVEAHQESLTIEPGDKVVVVDTPIGRIGLTICYDLRFSELYRLLVLKGAELFTVPSAFTSVTGLAHWESLLRARAIENLCYVLASNQGGLHSSGRNTHGHSMIIEPWGKIISEQQEGPGLIFADIDLPRLKELRLQFPCNNHHVLNQQNFTE
jgi:deaminated glutathione amidase